MKKELKTTKTMRPSMFIMCGLARSGKSTWVRKHAKNNIVICPDIIRKEIFGHQFHAPANSIVFSFAEAMARLILKQGKSIIIDCTNITHEARQKWYTIGVNCDAKITVVWTFADPSPLKNLQIIQERNKNSPVEEQVPEYVLQNMSSSFEEPSCENISSYKLIKFHNVSKHKIKNEK